MWSRFEFKRAGFPLGDGAQEHGLGGCGRRLPGFGFALAAGVFLAGVWGCLGAGAEVPAWRLIWADEFDLPDGSAPDPAKWTYDLGGHGWGNNELQSHTARRENSRIEGGLLVIEARAERYVGVDGRVRDYTSARIKTQGRATWTYGRVEARMQLTAGRGIWPAFWMLGANYASVGWPTCGEIDIMENVGHEPETVYGTVHGPGYSGGDNVGGDFTLPDGGRFADHFHLFAVEWEPDSIRWLVDNRVYFQISRADLPAGALWVFDHPFFLIMNVAVGGNWPGAPDVSTVFPQRLLVDYVRVYARASSPAPVLRTSSGPLGVNVVWPLAFPQGRLQRAGTMPELWIDMPMDGQRSEADFYAAVDPGLYRLVLEP
jgi:beta-glucanase (GH16 family)